MGDIATAIVRRLTDDNAIVGAIDNRIYPNYVKQGDKLYPQLVYELGEDEPEEAFDGATGVANAELTIQAIGKSYADAAALRQLVVANLDGSDGTWDGVKVQGVFAEGVQEFHVVQAETEAILYYVSQKTFKIVYER